MPDEPEALGLLALLLLIDARRPARTAPDGSLVRLEDQDRARWNGAQIQAGQAIVRRLLARNQPGPFQAALALTANAQERRFLAGRRAQLSGDGPELSPR